MSDVFVQLANMSITAGYLILAVLALRLILRKIPQNLFLWLWALVGIRLALPVSLESALSLIPKSKPIPADIALSPAPAIDSGIPVIDRAVNPVIAENFAPTVTASVNPMQVVLAVLSVVWLAGVVGLLMYAAIRYFRLFRLVRVSMPLEDDLYLCDGIPTPFVLGIRKPRIYLPSDVKPEDQSYVLRHERAHLRHHDNWWKPLGFLLAAVYWFNPLVWAAYLLFCRDLEMACDERAVTDLHDEEKKAYSYALLSCAAPRGSGLVCPVAFGENSVKVRIRNVLHYKKASAWVAGLVLLITTAAAVGFLTDPVEEEKLEVYSSAEGISEVAVKDGYFTYTNGGLHLEIGKIHGVETQVVSDENGEEYAQTTLLTKPGTVVTVMDAEGGEDWYLCEETGAQQPMLLTGELSSAYIALGYDNYYLRGADSRRVLLLKQVVDDLAQYAPATAKNALAYDRDTGELLYHYQRFLRIAPGDLNKLALALVVLENHAPEELVDTTSLPAYLRNPEYRCVGDGLAREMTVEDLLTLMLMCGYDDAAYCLARFDAGSEEAMVAKMNEYVKFACMDTVYTDLYGFAQEQYTTGYDTLLLVNRMLEDPCLSAIYQKTTMTLSRPEGKAGTFYMGNYLMDNRNVAKFYDERVTGGFAWYRGLADLICTAEQDGREVVCILLGAERKFQENGWVVEYWGNFEEAATLLGAVLG